MTFTAVYNNFCVYYKRMADRNEKILLELLKYPGNNVCADCGSRSKLIFLIISLMGVRYEVHNIVNKQLILGLQLFIKNVYGMILNSLKNLLILICLL